jgi:hypothetical protein
MKFAPPIILAIISLTSLSSCGENKPLPMVHEDDPVSRLNPDRWSATTNELMTPPYDGTPIAQPTATPINLHEVPNR